MKIHTTPPQTPVDGTLLTPELLNENYNYLKQVFDEANNRCLRRWSSTYLFGASINSGYTSAQDTTARRFYFPALDQRGADGYTIDLTIERVQITANYTATLPITLNVAGILITLPAESSSTDTYTATSLSTAILNLTPTPFMELSGSGTWSISRLVVQVFFRSDRYESSGTIKPTYTAPLFDDQTALTAATFNSLITTANTASATVNNSQFCTGWFDDTFHNITSSTAAVLTTAHFPIPATSISDPLRVARIWAYANTETNGSVGQLVSYTFKQGAATIGTLSLNIQGLKHQESGAELLLDLQTSTSEELTVLCTTNGSSTIITTGFYILLR